MKPEGLSSGKRAPRKPTGWLVSSASPGRARSGIVPIDERWLARSPIAEPLAASPPATSGPIPFWERLCSLTTLAAAALAMWVGCLLPHARPRAVEDPDIWWHLRNAGTQWHSLAWLHRDLYSWTAAGAPWIDHEWLSELPFYLCWRLAGANGLYGVTLLTLECIFLGLFWLAYRTSGSAMGAMAATGLAAVLATVSFAPRTLLFGWACLIVEMLLLESFGRREDNVLWLPPLFALWVNLHGSWLIGMLLLLVFAACGSVHLRLGSLSSAAWTARQRNRLAIALPLSAAALFVNPYGWRLVLYPFDMAFYQQINIASVEEWQPLNFQTARGQVLLLALGVLFAAQLVRRRNWTLYELAAAAAGVYAGCRHTRFLFLAGILLAPALACQLARFDVERPQQPPRRRLLLHAASLAAMLLLTLAMAMRGGDPNPDPKRTFPAAALPFLERFHPEGRLFNEYLWGGYLAYYTPALPVFIDSRMDIFERAGVLRDYLDIVHLKNSLGLLDRYRVRYVLFEKDTPLVYLLEQTRDWDPAYDDGRTVLLERRRPPTPAGRPSP